MTAKIVDITNRNEWSREFVAVTEALDALDEAIKASGLKPTSAQTVAIHTALEERGFNIVKKAEG